MDNNSDEQFLIIQSTVKANKKDTDEKLTQTTENLKFLIAFIMDHTNNSKFSTAQKDTLTALDHTTAVPDNRRDPPLDGVHSTKIGGMWTLKHEIISQKFYEILIKTEIKGDTTLDLNKLFNHINICLNAVTKLQEDLLNGYQSIKRNS